MDTYPNGAKYVPEKAEFAIFIANGSLRLALRSDTVLKETDAPVEYFEPITSFFGGPNQPIKKISGRSTSPQHFIIPSLIPRKIVVGEAEAIKAHNAILSELLQVKRDYEVKLQALIQE